MNSQHPSLSVVIPVFNEREWISRSVARVAEALEGSDWEHPEIVIVDDGSTDGTGEAVEGLKTNAPIRVIRRQNGGRLAARRTGIDAAMGEYVLLLDARVLVTGGLARLAEEVSEGRTVWNAHCEVNTQGNVFALFWDAMPRIFWSAYYAKPRTLSYGIDDFVKFPKGTTCFLAPRVALLDAYGAFSTKYSDPRDANDDTGLIEHLARRYRIWISPDFSCLYQPRQELGRFGPHAFHRGIVFVDAYLKPGNPYGFAIGAFCAGSIIILIASVRRPWIIPASLLAGSVGAVAAGTYKKLPRPHVRALALVAPLFALCYGAGIWMGVGMAMRQRLSPKSSRSNIRT